jgi:hypothetical protein
MSHSASAAWDEGPKPEQPHRRSCSWGKGKWSGWEIGAMVAGFVVFWPLGLVALFLKLKNGEMWRGASEGEMPWSKWKGKGRTMGEHFRAWGPAVDSLRVNSGNRAFEEYKQAELAKLDEMRRKLEEDQKAFGDFMERVRRAKDQEEFERFMAERNAAATRPETGSQG